MNKQFPRATTGFCSQCGGEIPETSKFCKYCGVKVSLAPVGFAEAWRSFNERRRVVKGRSTRAEFWLLAPLIFIILVVPIIIFQAMCERFGDAFALPGLLLFFTWLCCLRAAFRPTICLSLRRLHDINVSGWFYPLFFLPYVVPYELVVFPFLSDEFLSSTILYCKPNDWLLILRILSPFFNLVALIVVLIPGTRGANKYGPKPEKRSPNANNSK